MLDKPRKHGMILIHFSAATGFQGAAEGTALSLNAFDGGLCFSIRRRVTDWRVFRNDLTPKQVRDGILQIGDGVLLVAFEHNLLVSELSKVI